MGTKIDKRKNNSFSGFYIEGNQGAIAQLLHPSWVSRSVEQVNPYLKQIDQSLSKDIKLVVSGGGLIEIAKLSSEVKIKDWNSEKMLMELVSIVQKEIQPISALIKEFNRDYIIGIDVLINDFSVGQFAVAFSGGLEAISWKSYPVTGEDGLLAGFGTTKGQESSKIVSTSLGKGMVLVCHDSQAYNHRNRACVRAALRKTHRRKVMDKMDKMMAIHKPTWGVNLIHWIDEPKNLRTFSTSYKQIFEDHHWNPRIIGSFGYSWKVKNSIKELAKLARYPKENGVIIVLEATR